MEFNVDQIQTAVRMILEAIGEDPDREGLRDTPARVARMYQEVFRGLHRDPRDELNAIFNIEHEELVLVRDISFYSMCEHHLVPFFGKAHVAYLPRGGKVTGLSKLARLVETVARRPQLQERITSMVADAIMERLEAQGAVVVLEAEHMCMTMRGVNKPGSQTVTSAVRGVFLEDGKLREEVFRLILNR
ncbi:MAG: GTP cyclohydrolase I FolE [Alicyclobacillaceae bacterium]|nr:GTP cyclohydrolase I FolE [Alicyclobacillaceae bacterium]